MHILFQNEKCAQDIAGNGTRGETKPHLYVHGGIAKGKTSYIENGKDTRRRKIIIDVKNKLQSRMAVDKNSIWTLPTNSWIITAAKPEFISGLSAVRGDARSFVLGKGDGQRANGLYGMFAGLDIDRDLPGNFFNSEVQ